MDVQHLLQHGVLIPGTGRRRSPWLGKILDAGTRVIYEHERDKPKRYPCDVRRSPGRHPMIDTLRESVVDRPTFLTGIPRNGTSIPLESLARTPDVGWFPTHSIGAFASLPLAATARPCEWGSFFRKQVLPSGDRVLVVHHGRAFAGGGDDSSTSAFAICRVPRTVSSVRLREARARGHLHSATRHLLVARFLRSLGQSALIVGFAL